VAKLQFYIYWARGQKSTNKITSFGSFRFELGASSLLGTLLLES
jgi:hypothetical protein